MACWKQWELETAFAQQSAKVSYFEGVFCFVFSSPGTAKTVETGTSAGRLAWEAQTL